jgi:hypothetical protein
VKKKDGSPFPPKTLRQLVLLIQMYLNDHGHDNVRLLSDSRFKELQYTLDNTMKDRAEKGMGLHVKQAQVISIEKEEQLWVKGLLGSNNGQVLLDTLIYLIGLNFALRSGDEHRTLSRDQFQLHSLDGSVYLEYTEKLSKTNRRGLKDVKVPRKVCRSYERKDMPNRCLVYLYRKYLSLCPSDLSNDYAFYLQPLRKPTDIKWFSSVPVGKNTLSGTISRMCKLAGFEGEILQIFYPICILCVLYKIIFTSLSYFTFK